jgi:very-short-patch-repair endonuclease
VRIDGLGELLDQQFSVVSRGQLLELGMKDNAMQRRVRAGGPWQALLPGVYFGLTGAPNLLQKEMAALLYAGPGSLITGPTALMHHGLRSPVVLETVDVLVPISRHRINTGFVRLHRTARMPARCVSSGPLRLAAVPRAVADTARLLGEARTVRAVVADAVQRKWCTVADLATELREGPIRGSAMFRSALGDVAEGIRSVAEGDLRKLIRAARLPTPLYNASLFIGDDFLAKPDAWWPEAGVVVEVDSYEWHLSPADADRTRKRHDRMIAAGIYPMHFSPRQIRTEGAEVVRLIKKALERGRQCPPLPILTIPCPESPGRGAAEGRQGAAEGRPGGRLGAAAGRPEGNGWHLLTQRTGST